jgi:hypothetical protein
MKLIDRQDKREKLPRQVLFSRLPREVFLEGVTGGIPGKYECRLLLAREPFLTLTGLELGEKPFVLPLGTKLTVGFGLEEGWGEFECEVVGWSAGKEGNQVMLRCPAEGQIRQRRQYPRYLVRQMITLATSPARPSGETHNLSKTGMCVDFPAPLPENRNLDFSLLTEIELPIAVIGRVVWQQPSADAARYLAGISLAAKQDWPGLPRSGPKPTETNLAGGGN